MHKDKTQKLIIIVFSWFQHITGTSLPILENDNQTTKYVNSIWINDFIKLLKTIKVQLKLRSTNILKKSKSER